MRRAPLTILVLHPTTKDRAYAEDKASAEAAARTLRRDATEAGCNPRTRCLIVHLNEGDQECS